MLFTYKSKDHLPNKEIVTFKSYQKQQELANVVFADIECYLEGMNRSIGDKMFVISKQVPISVGFSWGSASLVTLTKSEAPFNNDCYEDYFGTDCIKHFLKDLDIESNYNINLIGAAWSKTHKPMILTSEDQLYHYAKIICRICDKQSINKVRNHCQKTGKIQMLCM